MNKNDQNLISLMVEETMNCASVFSVSHNTRKKSYNFSLHGFEVEVPENWSSFQFDNRGDILLPKEFLEVVGLELSCHFDEIKISKDFQSNLVLEVKSVDDYLESFSIAA